MSDDRCTYTEMWKDNAGRPLPMRCVLRLDHGPGLNDDKSNAKVPTHHLSGDFEHPDYEVKT